MSLLIGLWLVAPAPMGADVGAPGRVEQVTLTTDEQGPVILIRTSRALRYRSHLIPSPQRLVLDFEEARFAWRGGPLRPGSGPVIEVRGGQFRPGVARVVIALSRAVPHHIASTPDGLQVALRPSEPAAPSAAARASVEPAASPPAPGADTGARPVLYGIVLRGEDSVAYMEDPRTRRVTGFKRGDPVGAGVLEVIDERHVTVRMPWGPVDIRVDDPKPGAAPGRKLEVPPARTPGSGAAVTDDPR